MTEKINEARTAFEAELSKAASEPELDQVRVKFLSRNGAIAQLFDEMKSAPSRSGSCKTPPAINPNT